MAAAKKKTKKKTASKKIPAKASKGPAKASAFLSKGKASLEWKQLTHLTIDPDINARSDKNVQPSPELVASVRDGGVAQPIHVAWKGSSTVIVDGHRRAGAAMKAGVKTVPVVNHGAMADLAILELAVVLNREQREFTKKENYIACKKMLDAGSNVPRIAGRLGKSNTYIKDLVKIQKSGDKRLQEAAQKETKDGGISTKVAAKVADLPKKVQRKVVPRVKGAAAPRAMATVNAAAGKKVPQVRKNVPKVKGAASVKKHKLVKGAEQVAFDMEKVIREKLKAYSKNKVLNGQLGVLLVLTGRMEQDKLFPPAW
jgi:ParB/RepB/Spo0J family partition protein